MSWANRLKKNLDATTSFREKMNDRGTVRSDSPTSDIDCGEQYKLPYKYVLWSHDLYDKNWDIKSYKKLCTVETVSEFWRLFNNFNKLGFKYVHFFLMKEGIDPIWEHPKNRDGGVCSFRIELDNALNVWNDLGVAMACNVLNDLPSDINGVSISPKNNWAIIKIWNQDSSNDTSVTMSKHILDKYNELSIKYKANEPEY
jgi:hypothetical protein